MNGTSAEVQRRGVRRGVYVIPALFTVGNVFCGYLSLDATVHGRFDLAAGLIFLAGFLDSLDGRVARMTGSTSAFGEQLDSLADVLSFGLAPAFLVYHWGLGAYGRLGLFASFLFLVCGACRLARFNVQLNVVDKRWFVGLPIPAAAGALCGLIWVLPGAAPRPADRGRSSSAITLAPRVPHGLDLPVPLLQGRRPALAPLGPPRSAPRPPRRRRRGVAPRRLPRRPRPRLRPLGPVARLVTALLPRQTPPAAGATGVSGLSVALVDPGTLVGRDVKAVLRERGFPAAHVHLFHTARPRLGPADRGRRRGRLRGGPRAGQPLHLPDRVPLRPGPRRPPGSSPGGAPTAASSSTSRGSGEGGLRRRPPGRPPVSASRGRPPPPPRSGGHGPRRRRRGARHRSAPSRRDRRDRPARERPRQGRPRRALPAGHRRRLVPERPEGPLGTQSAFNIYSPADTDAFEARVAEDVRRPPGARPPHRRPLGPRQRLPRDDAAPRGSLRR